MVINFILIFLIISVPTWGIVLGIVSVILVVLLIIGLLVYKLIKKFKKKGDGKGMKSAFGNSMQLLRGSNKDKVC